MSHVKRLLVLLFLTLIFAFAGAAQEIEADKDETAKPENPPPVEEAITVTASRFERPLDLTPQSVSVVDSKAVHSRPMWNTASMLEDVPGVSFQRAGALDGQMVIRGLSSNDSRVVLFIDGDRFRGRNFLEYSLIDPNEVERIEVIRGPAAALYGSDAMNGVVNVITRRASGDPHQDTFSLRPRMYGFGYSTSNQLAATRLEVEGVGKGFDMLIGAHFRTAGNYDSPAGEIPNSDFDSRSVTARMGYSPSATQRFELIAKAVSIDAGRAATPGAPLVTTRQDPLKERFVRVGFTQASIAPWLQDLQTSLYYRTLSSILRQETRTAANGNVEFRNSFVNGPVNIGGKVLARSMFGNSVLSYGMDGYHEFVKSFEDDVLIQNAAGATTFVSPRARRVRDVTQMIIGALANYDWDPSSRWTVSFGGRYDVVTTDIDSTPALNEDPALTAIFAQNLNARDNALTGRAGIIFRPIPALHLVANVSTAFRTPTTGDKSGSGTVGALITLPDATLKPETSTSYEGGVRTRLRALTLNVTAFRNDYEDLLAFRFLNPTTRQRVNVGKARVEGFEIDGVYEFTSALAMSFNAANVRGTNKLTNVPLSYVPPLNGMVALRHSWLADAYWLEATGRWSRDKTRIDRTQERPTEGYEVFGLSGGADLIRFSPMLKDYRITVGIDNLFDKEYRTPTTKELVGFPITKTNPLLEPGRSLSINFTAGF